MQFSFDMKSVRYYIRNTINVLCLYQLGLPFVLRIWLTYLSFSFITLILRALYCFGITVLNGIDILKILKPYNLFTRFLNEFKNRNSKMKQLLSIEI